MPTYKDFKKAVYKSYKAGLKGHDQDEVEKYFKSEEAEEVMRGEYEDMVRMVKGGDISESVILTGGAGGCAQCLIMMF